MKLSSPYGTLAIIPLFMIWIYLLWLIFLFRAEQNAALHEIRQYDRFIKLQTKKSGLFSYVRYIFNGSVFFSQQESL
jgi:uncharacterized BrkB/YihY/UPF0761 family membrane protein